MKKNYLLLILLCSFLKGMATNYYVDPVNGNDNNNGLTTNNAFKSLAKIESTNLQAGDIVYFMEGVYTRPGQTLLTINTSGTEDNWIVFRNYPNHKPVFEFDNWTGIDVIGGSSYIKFDGLTIKGARSKINEVDALSQPGSCENSGGNPEGIYNGTGILVVGPNLLWSNPATNSVPHHITITNCEVYDCTSSGVAFQQADYITITKNKIYNNCWYTLYGTSGINLYQLVNTDNTTSFHNTITNNLLYGNKLITPQIPYCAFYDGNGLIVDDFNHTQTRNYKDTSAGFDAYTAKTLIANNISVENGGSGLHFFLSAHCYIFNNTIANNAYQNDGDNGNGELRIGRCNDFVIKNNLIKGENYIHRNGGNTNIEYTYNYQFGPNIQPVLNNCVGCIEAINIPFLNTDTSSNTPYITSPTSILVNSGTTISEINNDYNYQNRPDGGSFDIGAYELTNENPCELITWYADFDNDNLGDSNDTLLACEQPENYVATSGDLCPNDFNKIEAGECGCGEEEGTCDTTGNEICEAPLYDHNTSYADEGTLVLFDGNVYVNNWYASGTFPTDGGPWELIGFCDTEATDCTNISTWLADSAYATPGTQITYNGLIYQNQWYTSGDIPDESNAWELIGFCSENTNSSKSSVTQKESLNNVLHNVYVHTLNGQLLTYKTLTENTINSFISETNLPKGVYIITTINPVTGSKKVKKIIL